MGSLNANAIYNPENVVRLEAAFMEEMVRAIKGEFTAEEVEKAKQGWLQQQLQSRSTGVFLAGLLSNQSVTMIKGGDFANHPPKPKTVIP